MVRMHKEYQFVDCPSSDNPTFDLSACYVVRDSEQNKIRENIAKTKLVRKGQLFHLPICSIHRPPVDPESGRRPLEIREPHAVHVQNLKRKMKINPHATIVPFLVMVDPRVVTKETRGRCLCVFFDFVFLSYSVFYSLWVVVVFPTIVGFPRYNLCLNIAFCFLYISCIHPRFGCGRTN